MSDLMVEIMAVFSTYEIDSEYTSYDAAKDVVKAVAGAVENDAHALITEDEATLAARKTNWSAGSELAVALEQLRHTVKRLRKQAEGAKEADDVSPS